MNQYEVMYVIDTALDDQARGAVIDRFSQLVEQNGGKVDRIDEWGKRRLAYAINYKTEGYYVLMYISAPPQLPRELERNFKNADQVLRYLVIRFEGELPAKREPLKPAAPVQAAQPAPQPEEAPVPAAEEAADMAEEAVTVETVVDAEEAVAEV
ncbi:MAG: 30S ribosomal protein S6 [Clostridia bacterium]|nr:30S ribosomal protein S6 [Clostridia bacterium]